MTKKFDIAVLGAGPGGYVAALRASQLKKRVVLIEKDKVGGVCMNYGCIPTKYLLYQVKEFMAVKKNKNLEGPLDKIKINWPQVQAGKRKVIARLVKGIEFLLQRNGVTLLRGTGSFLNDKQIMVQRDKEEVKVEAEKIILATGSQAAALPFLSANGQQIITSRQALELEVIPSKIIIVGAGAIGLEMGLIFHKIGSEVHILEVMPTILPGSDKALTTRLERFLRAQGLNIYTQMRIEESKTEGEKVVLKGSCLKDNKAFSFKAEKVLLAVGRKPNLDSFKNIKFSLDEKGFLKVNSFLETEVPGIFAIGDLIGGKLLAHKASHQGLLAVENA
ncbi:MAG: dihydrolipoyl dehydrogenase family protein, partial [Candidatus Aminicenantales bacterium]